jgi:hypothetical protein
LVEDYVHSDWVKIPAVLTIHCACFALAVVGIVATLRIANQEAATGTSHTI